MKSFVLLLAGLELAAGHPQHEHPTHSHPTASVSTPVPIPTGSTPEGCKVLSSDSSWPAPNEWTSALPDVTPREANAEVTRPDYHLAVEDMASVQAAVNFTAENNIRLTVVNSGHDFLGRNDAPSGLGLDVSMLNGIKVLESFTPTEEGVESPAHGDEPNTISPVPGQQAAVTFGAGASTQEINDALDPSGLFTMGAAHGSVKTAGGYSQTSGHAPFSSKYGLAADQVLEYKVVTADSQLVVANNVTNPDLFWALRGGGGSTFGIVVESTVKAFPSPKMGVVHWWINATNSENPGQGFWDSAAYLHSQFPDINEKGVQGYYYVYPDAMKGVFLTGDEDSGKEKADAVWNPILNELSSFPGMANATSEYDNYATFKEFFDSTFGAIDCGDDGHGHDHKRSLQKRHGDGAEPMGITPMDSRLLGAKHLKSSDLAQALKDAMPRVPDGQLRGHLVGGGKVFNPDDDTSVNPAWRQAYVHLIGTGAGEFTVDSLRTLAPDSGAYANEASAANPNWKQEFWGDNYEKLSELKTKYDPNGVFWATPGINADEYSVVDGRVCKTASTGDLAPVNDNKNIATQSEGNEDPSSAFPGTVPPGHGGNNTCPGEGDGGHDGHDGHDGDDGHDHDDGEGEIPDGVVIEPDLDPSKPPVTEGAELTKVRYGPYDVDAMGMISNRPDLNIETPCKDCYITALQASLEYENGTSANVDTGGWLHHMVLYNNGMGNDDLVCDSLVAPQRIYASGNERIVSRVNGVADYGIEIKSSDSIGMIYDLMNESDSPQTYFISITYEWLPTSTSGYKAASMAWLDITDCGLSSVPAQEGAFELRSKGWTSTISGRLLSATGHVHDGGVDTVILKNGDPICTSVQVYGHKPGFTAPGGDHGGHSRRDGGHGGAGVPHISGAGVCEDFGTVEVGDELVIVANYNTTAHPLDMGHDDEPHDIMGISRVYIGT